MIDELNITTTGENPTVTILQGQSLPLKEPQKIRLAGDIEAISEFLMVRSGPSEREGKGLQFVDDDKAIVIADKENNKIQLLLDPENFYGTEITATLEKAPELDLFRINQAEYYSREDLITLFRFNKVQFAKPEKCDELVKSLQKFSVNSHIQATKEDDTRGNVSSSFTKKVETGIPETFVLNMPIYKGQAPEEFEVNICLDTVGQRVDFWFESTQLAELLKTRRDEIFAKQLAGCVCFPIINK